MSSDRALPFFRDIPEWMPQANERVLLLAPPGELGAIAEPCCRAVGPARRVTALLRGEPFLHAPLPASLELVDAHPTDPSHARGPFDLVCAWGSHPFLDDLDAFIAGATAVLRPGGTLHLEVPATGFSTILQAADPEARSWVLPGRTALEEACDASGLRAVTTSIRVDLREFETLGDLLDDRVAPDPVRFEGSAGSRRLREFRGNLASAFAGSSQLSLALRMLCASAMR